MIVVEVTHGAIVMPLALPLPAYEVTIEYMAAHTHSSCKSAEIQPFDQRSRRVRQHSVGCESEDHSPNVCGQHWTIHLLNLGLSPRALGQLQGNSKSPREAHCEHLLVRCRPYQRHIVCHSFRPGITHNVTRDKKQTSEKRAKGFALRFALLPRRSQDGRQKTSCH